MYTMGIDIGSSSSKVVIMENGYKILSWSVVQLGTGSSGPKKAVKTALGKSNIKFEDIKKTIATGYGRKNYKEADIQLSEISCHAKGVSRLMKKARTIIDIGGQDVKAIKIDKKGNVDNFFMNDKCAAGTGRFLEVMSKILEIDLDEMGDYDKKAKEIANISSTCTVFAESEVISQLSNNVEKRNIVAGVHKSVASKACSLAYRVGLEEDVVMCGGVAKNSGVIRAIERELGKKIHVAENPQITGALGAAVFAYEKYNKER